MGEEEKEGEFRKFSLGLLRALGCSYGRDGWMGFRLGFGWLDWLFALEEKMFKEIPP